MEHWTKMGTTDKFFFFFFFFLHFKNLFLKSKNKKTDMAHCCQYDNLNSQSGLQKFSTYGKSRRFLLY